MRRKVILFTGQSGLDSKTALNQFIDKHSSSTKFRERPIYFKIEDTINDQYCKKNKISSDKKRKEVWRDFLMEPYKIQEEYWQDAFKKIFLEINRKENKERTVFLNLHICYFHRKTLEYLSLIDFEYLKKLQPTQVITLIDDIYDIHERLRKEPDDLFYPDVERIGVDIIFEYLIVLQWRAKEIMLSRFIAKNMKCAHYVFSIKHNWKTLSNLAFTALPTVYFSHPITEVRRLESENKKTEAATIKKEITELSDELKEYFVPFLPTTIDEFRIFQGAKPGTEKQKKIYYPRLTSRWEKEKYIAPKQLLYSFSGFTDKNELWKNATDDAYDNDFILVLKTLSDTIGTQVTTRDYALVEQSKLLVVYRPLFNGNASGGVKKETHYHDLLLIIQSLKKVRSNKVPTYFVYCPKQDISLFKRNTFGKLLQAKIKSKIFFCNGGTPFSSLAEQESETLDSIGNNRDGMITFLKGLMHRHDIHISHNPDLKDYSPLKHNPENIEKIYSEIVDNYIQLTTEVIEFYRKFTKEFPDHSVFDSKKFVARIRRDLSPRKKTEK